MEAENIKIKPAPKDRKLSPSPFGNRLESAKFAVIRIDGLPVARLLTKHRHYTQNPPRLGYQSVSDTWGLAKVVRKVEFKLLHTVTSVMLPWGRTQDF